VAVPKALVELRGTTLLAHSLERLAAAGLVEPVVVHTPGEAATFQAATRPDRVGTWVPGGRHRGDSVRAGVAALPADVTVVAVHDAARALVPADVVRRVVAAVQGEVVAAAPALPVADTLKRIAAPLGRDEHRPRCWTPWTGTGSPPSRPRRCSSGRSSSARSSDGRRRDRRARARRRAAARRHDHRPGRRRAGLPPCDEGDLPRRPARRRGAARRTGGGHVTRPRLAVRVGNGLDVHPFADEDGRPLVLAGTTIPGAPGLAGHSDADVVAHAVADALLGACALGDLGSRFGVDRPELAGADSLRLLAGVVADVADTGYLVGNVDVTIVAQRPRLAGHREAMRAALAATCCGSRSPTCRSRPRRPTTSGPSVAARGSPPWRA
jgi:2-C-methyl-D-erythritol 4-phosphate cytidylyltransferase / 2-C-methyl-D-erythritol 2,4-cyclodiphosphate synthase